MSDLISRQAAISRAVEIRIFGKPVKMVAVSELESLPSTQPGNMKEYNLKKIYNIYVKIAQAHFLYQPSKPKTITAMPFDWIEAQNLLEKYLEDHGADFDALCREYVSENVKDDHLPSAQSEPQWIPCSERLPDKMDDYLCSYDGCAVVDICEYDTKRKEWGFFYDGGWKVVSNVIAWMPLPEPYAERREG